MNIKFNILKLSRIIIVFTILIGVPFSDNLNGQSFESNIEILELEITADTSLIFSQTIAPNSVSILSEKRIEYTHLTRNNILYIPFQNTVDQLIIKLRTLPIDFAESKSALDSSRINKDERIMLIETDFPNQAFAERLLIDSKKLEYTGSFSRGVSFGNTQDVVLNSNFNLQMRGDLGNGLFVKAAISDENIPIQPEGNTQILQEFDKVFIEVQKDQTKLIAGDYELSRPKSYFINYYKKLKGLSASNIYSNKNGWVFENNGNFAISRGKFRRQILQVNDGNQGPYKLQGENGELFLQVLSGTEKVFADGRVLKRGENEDYIIDYNRGEIRFTPQTIITANLRIIVEFEYAIQSYLRSLYATKSKISKGDFSFYLNFYNEQDSKSLTSNIQLDSTDLRILREGGDGETRRSGIFLPDESVDNNVILYQLNNNILSYQPDAISGLGAIFSNFGSANGDYIIDTEANANGRVYKYVGENEGNYAPFIELEAPEKKFVSSFATKYSIKDSSHIYLETSLSNNDLNRFSSLDNEDNVGLAHYLEFVNKSPFLDSSYWLTTQFFVEKANKNYRALNPYRGPEFARDWNLENAFSTENQLLISGNIGIEKERNKLTYGLKRFSESSVYNGTIHKIQFKGELKNFKVNAIGNWMAADNSIEEIVFNRPRLEIQRSLFNNKWTIGTYFEKEKNLRNNITSNTLNPISFDYLLSRYYLKYNSSEKLKFELAFFERDDKRVINSELLNVTTSSNIEFGGSWTQSTSSQLDWKLIYRDYKVEENYLENDDPNKSFIGTLDHKLNLFKRGITINSYFESNSGQEPKIEFQFIEVQRGEGSYLWNDYNQDSIQQINEFEISPFSDQASYEKITVFNNEFINTNRNILNQSIKINPQKFISKKKSILKKIQLSSRYRIDQKKSNSENNSLLNFLNFDLNDPGLVAFASSFDHSLFFNRGNVKYDLQFSLRQLNNKIFQISGFDQRKQNSTYFRSRLNLADRFDALLESQIGTRSRESENFENQNFIIDFWSLTPQLNFRPSSKLRTILKYKFEKNKNTLGTNNESALINDGGLEVTWRQSQTSNLQFKFNYVQISFDGQTNSPLEFEMLQGLKNGNNILINLNYTRRISNSIDLIINYNGRKSEGSQFVNVAGVQMRALF